MKFKEQVNMILYNFHGMNLIAILLADIFEDQLAILFNLRFIEYLVSVLWHQYDAVGNLAIAMAKTAQFQLVSHPSHSWVAPPMAEVPNLISFYKKQRLIGYINSKKGEGSLHPRPEGRGIRDPLHSQCNKGCYSY